MAGRGRPSKYSEELEQKAWEYIENYEDHGHAIPSIAGMAIILGVRRETLHVWASEEKGDFSNILAHSNAVQEQVLITKGLKGEFNSNITKLALGKHGYHDKVDQTNRVSVVEVPQF